MGRERYHQIGRGFTVEEARRSAIEEARDYHGHEEGYSGGMNCATGEEDKVKCLKKPKLAKSCTVEKAVQKGARKWETVFVIEPCWAMSINKGRVVCKGTQGEALKQAKLLSLENQQEYTVRIDKQLVTGSTEIARVKPKKSERGEWEFTGLARC